ncbi:MAG: GAF domain-containing protein [Spirochaetes bacterium]|nr:GAF domain-containing protein [Spirochaetota bacterium]
MYINTDILNELYNFIEYYYNDLTLADYFFHIFSIKKEQISSANVACEKFNRILYYFQKMSGDQLFCYNAGRYYTQTKLFRNMTIPGIRFRLSGTITRSGEILKELFPYLKFEIKKTGKTSLALSIRSENKAGNPNYFFTEYIKGMLSQLPKKWNLPLAHVTVKSYPFNLEEIFGDVDVPFRKKESSYFLYDKEIAADLENISDSKTEQIMKNNIFIKDIFIKKNTILNSKFLTLNIKWAVLKYLKILPVFLLLSILIPVSAVIAFPDQLITENNILLKSVLLFFYELSIALLFIFFKNKNLKKIYEGSESAFLDEISEQRKIISSSIQDTLNRLRSIENVIEITKEIIHEKNIVQLFENIRKLSAKALNADRTTVFLHDKEKKELRSGPAFSEEKQEFRMPEDQGIVGEVFKLKKIVNVKDAYNNPNFSKTVDRQTGYETKTILSAPLLDLEKNFIGVIQVLNKKDGTFEEIDEHIIETLSTYIATALKDSITISDLQKRGINPDMINGLNSVTQYILNEYNNVRQKLSQVNDPDINDINPQINDIHILLQKLAFLFDEKYEVKSGSLCISDLMKFISSFINISGNTSDKNIQYTEETFIPADLELMIDNDLLEKTIMEILSNSLESIEHEGKIILSVYNYVIITNDVVHEYSLNNIIEDYNSFTEENRSDFIKFLASRKPLLETDITKIKENMKEYIAFNFFDTGEKIPSENFEKIYHPFFSTRSRFGLGLATVKAATDRMQCILEGPVTSADGKSFRILLPYNKPD